MRKLLSIIIITVITIIIFIFSIKDSSPADPDSIGAKVNFGVTFSPAYARYLNLDWQKTYLNILDDLKVKNLRLPSYWDSLEPKLGQYDFSETDFMLSGAKKAGARVVLVVGVRQPRWPECQIPAWAKKLSVSERQQKIRELIQKVVQRYRDNPAIWAWQVENEQYAYWFGICDPLDKKFLQEEINLVKKLDRRPILLTDSGEWGSWVDSLNSSDILGISIYRKVYNSPLSTYLIYPFPAGYYSLKGRLTEKLTKDRKIIVSELQMEPWLAMRNPAENTPSFQNKLFSPEEFKKNIEFVRKTGFDEAYLWGIEWWYWMAQNGYPQYLDSAKLLFR